LCRSAVTLSVFSIALTLDFIKTPEPRQIVELIYYQGIFAAAGKKFPEVGVKFVSIARQLPCQFKDE
jgi:hypothetical protein